MNVTIPEDEWQNIQSIIERIRHRCMDQETDIQNLNNLFHALHGEGVRDRRYTGDGNPAVFVDGKWVSR